MKKLFAISFVGLSILLLVSMMPLASAHHTTNCNLRTTLAPTHHVAHHSIHVQHQPVQYWSAWNSVRLNVHHPHSSGHFSRFGPMNQHPGPYAHSYRPFRPHTSWHGW